MMQATQLSRRRSFSRPRDEQEMSARVSAVSAQCHVESGRHAGVIVRRSLPSCLGGMLSRPHTRPVERQIETRPAVQRGVF